MEGAAVLLLTYKALHGEVTLTPTFSVKAIKPDSKL
jgi:hypothetical protein